MCRVTPIIKNIFVIRYFPLGTRIHHLDVHNYPCLCNKLSSLFWIRSHLIIPLTSVVIIQHVNFYGCSLLKLTKIVFLFRLQIPLPTGFMCLNQKCLIHSHNLTTYMGLDTLDNTRYLKDLPFQCYSFFISVTSTRKQGWMVKRPYS